MEKSKEIRLGGDRAFNVIGVSILAIAIIFCIYPLIWMVLNSFRTNSEMFVKPLSIPSAIDFGVFAAAWSRANFNSAFFNSIINTASTVALVLVTASPAAFALSRMKFPGNKLIVKLLTASIIISGQLILIPLFFVMKNLNIYNTLLSTILGYTAMDLPLCIYLFYGFFNEIPVEIEESSKIDGCSKWNFYTRFIIPLSRPIISTIVIFVSLWSWNEYLYALTFLKDDAIRTIPLQIQTFFGRYSTEYNMVFAVLSISIIPVLAVYVAMQGSFIKGLTAGAVKI
jgi:raffinose/stachyose/melibiose transport system permease protein